jgi:hypothetical protein
MPDCCDVLWFTPQQTFKLLDLKDGVNGWQPDPQLFKDNSSTGHSINIEKFVVKPLNFTISL